ncbi:10488_t:CDS:2 [Paraglomus brasilianum]|uniref:10488_t:CDS:1 n=1 Tax=Paraglomus brasilianum TaxID=144538 RepID=A0A9N9B8U7_9GLOM|nr:10488_t:CDS:2 [Paraglomus brasilianum]
MNDLVERMEEAVKDEGDLDNSDIDNSTDDPASNSNTNSMERQQNLTEHQQLQTEITNLESNPNKTAEQQAELEAKRKKLQKLEELLRKQNNSTASNPAWNISGSNPSTTIVYSTIATSDSTSSPSSSPPPHAFNIEVIAISLGALGASSAGGVTCKNEEETPEVVHISGKERMGKTSGFHAPELTKKHIEIAVNAKYGKGEYELLGNNCEHFATMCVYGLGMSRQARSTTTDADYLLQAIQENNQLFKEMEDDLIEKGVLEANNYSEVQAESSGSNSNRKNVQSEEEINDNNQQEQYIGQIETQK